MSLKVVEDVSQLIAKTPLIKLHHLSETAGCQVYAKVEGFNPGNSAKDRTALYIIEQAEQRGHLKKGDTIIEATSGNMGFSIAMICNIKGYNCLLTVKDNVSKEKLSMLKAMNAKIILCPSNVDSSHPESYYNKAKSLSIEINDSYYLNQNYSIENSEAHYQSTGPEIWNQTDGKITHFICPASTCGTLVGCGRYLKEKNPEVKIIGVDGYGSILQEFHIEKSFDKNKIAVRKVEGLGKDIIGANYDRSIINEFIKVTDKDSALQARKLCKDEGLFAGHSSGSSCQALEQKKDQLSFLDFVVLLFPDHGSRYLSKIYNDSWMEEQGYIIKKSLEMA